MTISEERQLPPLRLYNTLGRREEPFQALAPPLVRMYTCGPTVYHFTHIGNLRSFLTADILRRTLELNGYEVVHVKNITDVGHLRDEVQEAGADRVEAAAREQGMTPQEVADFYTEHFIEDERRLNIKEPAYRPRATDHIDGMISLAQRLIDAGFAYPADGSVYFDVRKFPTYGLLSGNRLEDLVAGERVDIEPAKRYPADFALWKAGDVSRAMNWPSPWGRLGFPGWHIECSVMSEALLGSHIDIHTGGIDNLFPHHEDERAQTEAATGERFVQYWVHTAHLVIGSEKMSRSLTNFTTLSELAEEGIEPLAFRHFVLQAHYRKQLNWSREAVESADIGLQRTWDQIAELMQEPSEEIQEETQNFRDRFFQAVNSDLGTPRALAVFQQALDSQLNATSKLALCEEMDQIFGLDLIERARARSTLSPAQKGLVEARARARESKDWPASDELREQLHSMGVEVRDTPKGQRFIRRS